MADGDILKLGIPKPYAKVYRQICEGGGSIEEWTRKAARGLKTSIEKYGDSPRVLIDRAASYLESLVSNGSPIGPDEHVALDREIRRQQMRLRGRKAGMDLASDAIRSIANDLQQGACIDDISDEAIRRFARLVYDATFTTPVDVAPKHWDDMDKDTIKERIQAMDEDMQKHIEHFVKQLCKPQRKKPLTMLRRRKPKLDLDTEFE